MYIDGIKLYAKNRRELEILIQAIGIYSQDIGMDFSIEKCAILLMWSRESQLTEGIEQPNRKKKSERSEKKEIHKYFGILEADNIKWVEMK